jgi:hypothetical protein
MASPAFAEEIISFPTKDRVLPGKPADDGLIYAVAIHVFQEIVHRNKTGMRIFVKKMKGSITPAKGRAMAGNHLGQ